MSGTESSASEEGNPKLQDTFCRACLKSEQICRTFCLSGGLIWKVTLRLNMFTLYLVPHSRDLS